MYCKFCAHLNLDDLVSPLPSVGYKHHACFADIVASGKAGCRLCELINFRHSKHFLSLITQYGLDTSPILITAYAKDGASKHDSLVFGPIHPESGTLVPLTELDVFVSPDDELANLFVNRRISASETSWSECFETVKNWFNECTGYHDACLGNQMHPLPSRVLDISSDFPHLLETEGQLGKWAALSHCWGQSQPLRTVTTNYREHKSGITWSSLPPLYQDAIIWARKLDFQYLWIDSLCILQDSFADWVAESAKMGDIYKHASMTISSEAVSGCTKSYFEQANIDRGRSHYPINIPVRSATHGPGILSFQFKPSPEGENYVTRRAWTLQEQILSPRLLILNSEMVRWKCREKSHHEDRPKDNMVWINETVAEKICLSRSELPSLQLSTTERENFEPIIMQLWGSIAWNSSRRGITFASDRLPAISGLAREVYRHTEWTYLAGLWKEYIHLGLLWSTRDVASLSKEYVAPSWSWASLDIHGPVGDLMGIGIPETWHSDFEERAELLEATVQLAGNDPFGQVFGGKLQMRGPLRRADLCGGEVKCLDIKDRSFWVEETSSAFAVALKGKIACELDCVAMDGEVVFAPTEEFYFQLAEWKRNPNTGEGCVYGLMLERIGKEEREYRRVGRVLIPVHLSEGWEMEDILIV